MKLRLEDFERYPFWFTCLTSYLLNLNTRILFRVTSKFDKKEMSKVFTLRPNHPCRQDKNCSIHSTNGQEAQQGKAITGFGKSQPRHPP
ncbi:hypothetical protein AVEN_61657-1 [Araneus ventricosus]|uniref:Uncharacterized protein n=1 Tax=Araneus ventricosus TaxID=182803 RepID=A0A4Y2NSS4_ARAVE|nr:hypothetical protein AVEN_61657-1 [Araneus ventricosus]